MANKPSPVRVSVTGAAGQIGYSLLFRIAAGEMLGKDQPIILQLLEIPPAMKALEGVKMELEDCAAPLIRDILIADDPNMAFRQADYALLVGSRPRGKGMERKDLLAANASIFSVQGRALNDHASRAVKVLVVGNPANTNCLIAQRNAPDLEARNFTAMTRLDQNRAIAMLARKTETHCTQISDLCIWGNHSSTQYPDIHRALVAGAPALELVDMKWYQREFIPNVQKRGAAIINARGASSAASAANAAIEHMRDWVLGSDQCLSMAVRSEGEYDIQRGLIYSFPVRCHAGDWQIIQDIEINEFSSRKMRDTEAELVQEQSTISHLLPA